jgi:LCP family protein required for cell wall assembly
MADRPKGSGAPEEGTPEYEWLYGSKGQAPSDDATRVVPAVGNAPGNGRSARPDETRVMPAAQRDSRGSGGRPPGGPTRTTTAAPPRRPAPVKRRPRFRFGVVKWILLLWLVFMLAVPLWAWSQIEKVDAEPDGDRPADQPGTNYLIVGSDKADDLTDDQREALQTGPRGGTNTDTIIVLHTGSGPDTMMSIPRDTLAEIPGHGTQMINAAFSLGKAPLLVASVEKLTGIHIDHYVELGFGSVINTVDALGGVEVCPKIAMKDPQARLDIDKGCQEVDGETALAYSRSRHVTALSDLDRVARQREVISALGDKATSPWTFLNPVRYWGITQASANAIRIDEEMGPIDLGRFALGMTGDNQTCTMPNLPAPSDPNRIVVDTDRAPALFKAIIADDDIPKAACTSTGRARQ